MLLFLSVRSEMDLLKRIIALQRVLQLVEEWQRSLFRTAVRSICAAS